MAPMHHLFRCGGEIHWTCVLLLFFHSGCVCALLGDNHSSFRKKGASKIHMSHLGCQQPDIGLPWIHWVGLCMTWVGLGLLRLVFNLFYMGWIGLGMVWVRWVGTRWIGRAGLGVFNAINRQHTTDTCQWACGQTKRGRNQNQSKQSGPKSAQTGQ